MDKRYVVSSPKDPFGVPLGLGSEPESEEEDVSLSLYGLTRRLATSSLLDEAFNYPGRVRTCRCGEACPAEPHATWQLLCAAAAEVERMKLERELLGPTRKPDPPGFPPDLGLYHKLQAAHRVKEEQLLKQRREGGGGWGGKMGYGRESGVSSSGRGGSSGYCGWPRQQIGSGGRGGGFNVVEGKRECVGTGVFLPRRVGPTAVSVPRTKSGAGSTVVLPARVVQALNLNLDEMGPPVQPRFTPHGDAALRLRNGEVVAATQKRASRAQSGVVVNSEIRLPQEWTY